MNNPDLIFESLEKKLLVTSILWCGSGSGIRESFWPWIRDGKNSDPGTVINILDLNHYSKLGVLSLRIFENLDVQSHQKFKEKVLGSSYRLFIMRDLTRLMFSVIRVWGLRGLFLLWVWLQVRNIEDQSARFYILALKCTDSWSVPDCHMIKCF